MNDNRHLVKHLLHSGVLKSPDIVHAFEICERALFVPQDLSDMAYEDIPLPIGEGQTISQPYTVAIMLELLQPEKGDNVLDIGSGSGWTTALIASIVGHDGFVEGIERIPFLVDYGMSNIHKMRITNASVTLANRNEIGKPGYLYDRILVSASADSMPESLFSQLKKGGRLVIPIQNSIWCFTKDNNNAIHGFEIPGFRFVPLIQSSSL